VLFISAAILAAEPESTTVIGVNEDLAAGARALQMKDYEEGIRLTIEGLKFESERRNRVSALSNICAGYTALRQYVAALENCDEAIDLDDRNWHAFNNRALAYLGQGNIKAARRDLEAGLALNPDSRKLLEVAEMIEAREKEPPLAIDD
jgi:tetratricopeptide (TPR) repeat protein